MTTGNGHRLHFGGLPTTIEVKQLREHFGAPAPGLIAHEAIATIVQLDAKSSRYRTVLTAWRRALLKEHDLDTAVEPGEGLRVLTEPEALALGIRDLGSGIRKARRTTLRLNRVKREALTDAQRERHTIALTLAKGSFERDAKAFKALEPPKPTPALPRRQA